MNILVIRNSSYDKSGDIKKIVDALTSVGHQVFVVERDRNKTSGFGAKRTQFVNGIEIILQDISKPLSKNKFLKRLQGVFLFLIDGYNASRKIVTNENIDFIHAFDLDAGLIAKRLKKKHNIPYNYHILDFYAESRKIRFKSLKKLLKKVEFNVINDAKNTIVCTEERKKQILGSNPKSLSVIYNTPLISEAGIDPKKISSTLESNDNKLRVCYIGTLSNNRLLFEMIELTNELDFLNLTIGGRGYASKDIEEAASLSSRVTFIGEVPYEKTFDYYGKADLMVAIFDPSVPNHKYSAPNKVFEAMFLGKSIILGKDTGLSNFIKDYNIGLEVEYSKEDLKEAFIKLHENKSLLTDFGRNSKEAYVDFNWDKTKQQIIALYE